MIGSNFVSCIYKFLTLKLVDSVEKLIQQLEQQFLLVVKTDSSYSRTFQYIFIELNYDPVFVQFCRFN